MDANSHSFGNKIIRTINSLLSAFIILVEQLKGNKVFQEIKHPRNCLGQLAGYSIAGYRIEIFCQRKHYRRVYEAWFIPNTNHIAYRVFSVVTADAPERLKEACKLDIDIPALLPEIVGDHMLRQAAVDAYLDILIEKLGPDESELSPRQRPSN